ncbi:hypothetical protein CLV86_1467 [Lacinutrix venerupis]|uniref:hypothetical protein n=1 Tax=Lacinutrix venerupis TaxID=1486034 RepID=UPI000EB07BAF|nr:hypothetical protein [Lacinutrix venerupis]RLJ64350.1 hypothetical protein CLV86_1467 [Lacinutrix venerupis]
MGIFGKLFGSKQNEEVLTNDNYIETIIQSGEGEPLAISNNEVMYVGYNELGGYYYLQTFIVGRLKVKTKNGAKLEIIGNNYTLNLNSDMPEFESESASPLDGHVTRIDFQIEKADVEKIKRSNIKQLTLYVKKKEILFNLYSK